MNAVAVLDPALESLLAFWAEAGVDAAVEDEPTDKLRRPEPPTPRLEPAPAPAATGLSATPDLVAAVAEARAVAAQAGDLAALQSAAAVFDPGPFRPSGVRRGVLARGEAPADVVVIGGAPGADEDASGAFAGAPGRLLDRMMAAAGLAGRALLVHSALWRTPGGRPPTAEEAALARPFVERAVALADSRALLFVGDLPARLLLGRGEGVLKLRREALTWTTDEGANALPAFVTFGPEFLLRQPAAKKQAWEDLLSLAARVAPPVNGP